MIRFAYTLCAALLILGCVSLIPALSQMGEEKKGDDMMEKWTKLAQPGPQHKMLAEGCGNYDISGWMKMDPAGEAQQCKGKATMKMLYDRYVLEECTVGEGAQAMHWTVLRGYDNSSQTWQALPFGDMGTALRVYEGKMDEKTGVGTFSASWVEKGMDNMKMSERVVVTPKDKDHATLDMYDAYGDMKEFQAGHFEYSRTK